MFSVLITSSFLILLKIIRCTYAGFLDSVSGEISAGNFSYFTIVHPGLISLELISHVGDCDIYVSQHQSKPSFEPSSYCLQSSSCGVDTVIVPKSYKRPLAIGIYGHPSHEVSSFTLNIFQIDCSSDTDDELDELYLTTKYGSHGASERYGEGEASDYGSLPFIMILFYYVYNFVQYFLDFSVYAPFAPNELIELFLELLFF